MEDEIEWAVTQLRNHRSGEPSGIQAEHLKRWMAVERKAEKGATMTAKAETTGKRGNTEVWLAAGPTEGNLAEEATRQAVLLIPKRKKDYQSIGLAEVMWKVVAAILNRRLMASIAFHNFFQGCRSGHGRCFSS